MLTLFDADKCPYCARVRIVLAEKEIAYETVVVDLDDRPAWIYEKNPLGKVPVLEEDAFVLPESAVIMEYLDERYPEPPLSPADPADRARGRLLIDRFDLLSRPYYALRRGEQSAEAKLQEQLSALDLLLESQPYLTGHEFGLADAAYLPWILRARSSLGINLDPHSELSAWVARTSERPSVAAELELMALEAGLGDAVRSIGSVHVQTDDQSAVERAVVRFGPRVVRSRETVVSAPQNGWIGVYDESAGAEPERLRKLASELSYVTGGVVIALSAERGAVVRLIAFERGQMMDEYLSVPEYYGALPPGDAMALRANPTLLSRLTGAKPAAIRAVARTADSPADLPPLKEHLAELAAALGIQEPGLDVHEAGRLKGAAIVTHA